MRRIKAYLVRLVKIDNGTRKALYEYADETVSVMTNIFGKSYKESYDLLWNWIDNITLAEYPIGSTPDCDLQFCIDMVMHDCPLYTAASLLGMKQYNSEDSDWKNWEKDYDILAKMHGSFWMGV